MSWLAIFFCRAKCKIALVLFTVNAKTGENIYMKTTNNLNRVLMAAVAVLAFATSAFAIPKGPCDPKPQPDVCCEEPAPGPFAFSYAKDMSLSCPSDFYLTADFLLMQAREDGLEYAMTQNQFFQNNNYNQFPLDESEVIGYTTKGHTSDWNYGVRVAMGFYLTHDAWDLRATYTYFRINNDKGIETKNEVLLPLWVQTVQPVPSDSVKFSARWTADVNNFDLTIGKPYHISRYVVFNPNVGIKFAKIDQDFKVRYGATWDPTTDRINSVNENDFWGIGMKAGFDTEWLFGAGFSLLAKANAALLYSHFDVEQHINGVVDDSINHEFYTVTPYTDLSLGLNWSKHFSKNRYVISLRASYEFQAWFDQNRMRRFFDQVSPEANMEASRANLYITGFVFGVGMDF
jgi:hypothetical protein